MHSKQVQAQVIYSKQQYVSMDTAITSLQVDCDTLMYFLFPTDVK